MPLLGSKDASRVSAIPNAERLVLPQLGQRQARPLQDLNRQTPPEQPEQELCLYGCSKAELDRAARDLAKAADIFAIRFTGGCLNLAEERAQHIQAVIREALHDFTDGIVISGATRAVSAERAARVRPSMAEAGSLLQPRLSSGRLIGIFPGRELTAFDHGLRVTADYHGSENWNVMVDAALPRGIVAQRNNSYLWDDEWQAGLDLIGALKARPGYRGALLLGYDGGRATENEYRAWAAASREDPSLQLVLITGSDPARATDKLAADKAWLEAHPQVHCLPPEAHRLRQFFADCGALYHGQAASQVLTA
jgi:hypothetical protein